MYTHIHTYTHIYEQVLGIPRVLWDRLVVDSIVLAALYQAFVWVSSS